MPNFCHTAYNDGWLPWHHFKTNNIFSTKPIKNTPNILIAQGELRFNAPKSNKPSEYNGALKGCSGANISNFKLIGVWRAINFTPSIKFKPK